jgi:hypothetical protein
MDLTAHNDQTCDEDYVHIELDRDLRNAIIAINTLVPAGCASSETVRLEHMRMYLGARISECGYEYTEDNVERWAILMRMNAYIESELMNAYIESELIREFALPPLALALPRPRSRSIVISARKN